MCVGECMCVLCICLYVCLCVRERSQSWGPSTASPCFTHKIQFPTEVQVTTHERISFPSFVFKNHTEWLVVVWMAVFVWNVCSLCKKLWTSASVKPWDVLYSLHLRTPLLLSVDLKIAFWFLNDRKQREDYFGISVIFNIFLYKMF